MVIVEQRNRIDSPSVEFPQRRIIEHSVCPHNGDPRKKLREILSKINPSPALRITLTGRKFRKFVNITSVSEPEAVEYAYRYTKPNGIDCPALVSAGGETFIVYVLDRIGQISRVITGNKCASGTGEFFQQQLRRMDVTVEDAANWTATQAPYQVSGRCSVFCKSDCTHATNKGIPKSKVTAGLCQMMASKILELLKKVKRQNIMIVGGTSKNKMMISYLKEKIPGLIVPQEATYFEALGAALWGFENHVDPLPDLSDIFIRNAASFDVHPPLSNRNNSVEFKTMNMQSTRSGDKCIIGLDVGSTTTKAILLRSDDHAILASIYLRTNGDPVEASRQCYRNLYEQVSESVDPGDINIEGLGVCGSGRQIAGLHAMTDGVINEIIAHARAAVYFDKGVDTIFEIGGQDAKYTFVTNGVPSDYAMNEACSAGTGSFLEESALESLNIRMENIGEIALKGKKPPNFNDQCAAFIASDIKRAIHEGARREDVVAGLVYSICMNYTNRVKGNRPVGNKIFMQGGVCYNEAIPLAMASLVDKPIIVPPEPGLMGAFGAALEVKNRMKNGLIRKNKFDLKSLANRTVTYGRTFVCQGGKEKCDRRCQITLVELDGDKYPFGGACNRYYNQRQKLDYNIDQLDLVRLRQHLVFDTFIPEWHANNKKYKRKRIGINKSFLINTYYPLYATFFIALGIEPVLPDECSRHGIEQRNAAFCYPAELAHGFLHSLLEMKPRLDYIFLPHFKALPAIDKAFNAQVCPIAQAEPFYLQAAFRQQLNAMKSKGVSLFSPLIDLTPGLTSVKSPLVETAQRMGNSRRRIHKAYRKAIQQQELCLKKFRSVGLKSLADLERRPDRWAVVLFGRPYNTFAGEAHMGVPHKLASRGILVIPVDFLPLSNENPTPNMYWGMGQLITKAAQMVKSHPQLFGVYVTNFSCGPDSFLLSFFRSIMGRKPSLTLELDSHTADAGLETRIEAFIDIVSSYRKLNTAKQIVTPKIPFYPAQFRLNNSHPQVITSNGQEIDIDDPRVTLLFPSMGRIGTVCLAAAFKGKGLNAKAHPPATEADLKTGRANTSCKECLPLILTTGTLLNYIKYEKKHDEVLVYFMAGGSGPCRFGQYSVFMEKLIERLKIPDVAMLTLSSENSYAGLETDFQIRGWWAIVISDVLEDIRSMLLANACNKETAMDQFEEELQFILQHLQQGDFNRITVCLKQAARKFSRIRLKRPPHTIPTIFLAGEIFVRRDSLSRQYLTEWLAKQGIATICAPVAEWLLYTDYLFSSGRANVKPTWLDHVRLVLRTYYKRKYERKIKSILSASGLVHAEPINIDRIINTASPHLSPDLSGEAILTIGSALIEIATHTCGVISIGPFGCMPNRISEAVLSGTMNRKDKLCVDSHSEHMRKALSDIDELPFLAIESDGSPFPQIIEARLEAFCLQAKRLHERLYAMN
jgi:predicted CoA-substrate-specific enzyme activase